MRFNTIYEPYFFKRKKSQYSHVLYNTLTSCLTSVFCVFRDVEIKWVGEIDYGVQRWVGVS